MDDETPAWLTGISALAGAAGAILLTWWTFLAFTGGTLWPIGVELEGGFSTGLLWLFVIDPLVATVMYWIGLAVLVPLAVASGAMRRR